MRSFRRTRLSPLRSGVFDSFSFADSAIVLLCGLGAVVAHEGCDLGELETLVKIILAKGPLTIPELELLPKTSSTLALSLLMLLSDMNE